MNILYKHINIPLLTCCVVYTVFSINQSFAQKTQGIGTNKPHPRAVLELKVEDAANYPQGFLLPKLSTSERLLLNTVTGLPSGLSVYDTDEKAFYIWDGTIWKTSGSLISIAGINGVNITQQGQAFTVVGAGSQWISAGTDKIYTNSFVGMGTSNPKANLDITNTGNTGLVISATGITDEAFITLSGIGSQQIYFQKPGATNDWKLGRQNSTDDFRIGTSTFDYFNITSSNEVIISNSNFLVGSNFQIDVNGNIVEINGAITNFPSTVGGANTFLRNDGSGNLNWVTIPSSQWISAGTDKIYTNSFVGIGTNNPQRIVDIRGTGARIQRLTDNAGDNAEFEFADAIDSDINRWRFGLRPIDQNNNFNIANWIGGNYNIRIYIDPTTGNVGIGNPNGPNTTPPVPSENFVVNGNSRVTQTGYFGTIIGNNLSGANGSVVTVDGTGKLGIGVFSSSQWITTTSGIYYPSRVGINGIIPLAGTALNIKSLALGSTPIRVENSGLGVSIFTVTESNVGGNGAMGLFDGTGTQMIQLATSQDSYLNFGNLGIGTTTPNEKLTVQGNSSVVGIGYFGTIVGNNLAGANGSIVTVDGTGKLGIGAMQIQNNYWEANGNSKIYTNSFVGIGNATPNYPLHIFADENTDIAQVIRKIVVTTSTGNHIGLSTQFTGGSASGSSKIGLQAFIMAVGQENIRGVSADIRGVSGGATNYRGLDAYIQNDGTGASQGVYAQMDGIGNGNSSGVLVINSQTGTGERYGINAVINGAGTGNKYAIYGNASGGTGTNYAGYFENGLFYVQNFAGFGVINPTANVDINGTIRFRTLNAAGAVLTVDGLGNVGMGTIAASTNYFTIVGNNIQTLLNSNNIQLASTAGAYMIGTNKALKMNNNESIFLGNAGNNVTEGTDNFFAGNQSGQANTTGYSNIFIGSGTGNANTIGNWNIFLGESSGLSNLDGENNIFLGSSSGQDNSAGDNNIFFGNSSGLSNQTGNDNIFIGQNAGSNLISGSSNVAIGNGSDIGNGVDNSIAFGNQASVTANNSVAIGYQSIANGPNRIVLGSNITGLGINTAPTAMLDVNGGARIRTLSVVGAVLTVDGLGNVGMGIYPVSNSQWLTTTNGIYYNSNTKIGDSPIIDINTELSIVKSAQSTESELITYSNTPNQSPIFRMYKSDGTLALPAAVTLNSNLGLFQVRGYDGVNFFPSLSMLSKAEENWSPANRGSSFDIRTTKIGTTTTNSRIFISGTGEIALGNAADMGTHTINGTLLLTSLAGATDGSILTINGNGQIGYGAAAAASQWQSSGSDIYYNSGNVGIGTNSPTANLQIGSDIQTEFVLQTSADGTGRPFISFIKTQGTQAAPTAVLDGMELGGMLFIGRGTSSNVIGAEIFALASENFTDTEAGTRLEFRTASLGSNASTTKMTLSADGFLGIGTTTPSNIFEVVPSTGQTISLTTNVTGGSQFEILSSNANEAPAFGLRALNTSDRWTFAADPDVDMLKIGKIDAAMTGISIQKVDFIGYDVIIGENSAFPGLSTTTINSGNFVVNALAGGVSGSIVTVDGIGKLGRGTMPVASPWLTSGANVYYNSGSVGIGTNTPSALLDVQNAPGVGVQISGSSGFTALNVNQTGAGRAVSINTAGVGTALYVGASSGYAIETMGKMYIQGGATITGATQFSNYINGVLSVDGMGNLVSAPISTSQWTTLGNDIYYTTGSVGIGTPAPSTLVANDVLKNLGSPTNSTIYYGSRAIANIGTSATDVTAVGVAGIAQTNDDINIGVKGEANAVAGINYGGYFSASGGAINNIGAYFSATGGTNNYAAIFNGGNVGIGTNTPAYRLHVVAPNATSIAGMFEGNTSSVNDPLLLQLKNTGIGPTGFSFSSNNKSGAIGISNDGEIFLRSFENNSNFMFYQPTNNRVAIFENTNKGAATFNTTFVGINTTLVTGYEAMRISSVFDGDATKAKGLVLPYVTTAQMANLTTSGLTLADQGMIFFNTDKKDVEIWDGTQWQSKGGEGGGSSGNQFNFQWTIFGSNSIAGTVMSVGGFGRLGTADNYGLAIQTGNQTRIFVNTTGGVGIGFASDVVKSTLQVNGDLGLGNGLETGNKPVVVWLRNESGGSVGSNRIVVVSTVTNDSFTTTTTAQDNSAIGVLLEACNSGQTCKVAIAGVAEVIVLGGAMRGQHCVTSTVSGEASSVAIPNLGASIGVFISGGGPFARVLLR